MDRRRRLGLVGKHMVVFVFALTELFFAIYCGSGVMMLNVYSSAVFAAGSTSLHSNFTWTGSSRSNRSWSQKTTDIWLPDGEDRMPLYSLVLTQYRSVTDRQTDELTDRQTDGRICRTYTSLAERCENDLTRLCVRTIDFQLLVAVTSY